MMGREHLTRRRFLATLAGSVVVSSVSPRSLIGSIGRRSIRIGVVVPTRTGASPVLASVYDYVGEAARMGAVLAADRLGEEAVSRGLGLDVLLASAPGAEAAFRAAERLVATEEVCALIGGLGAGQADALDSVANTWGIPFLNIGSPSDLRLGQGYGTRTFHVEASAGRYMDALVRWFSGIGHRRWFLIHEDSGQGAVLRDRALAALSDIPDGGRLAGSAEAAPEQPVYNAELDAIRRMGADAVLLLLDARDQVAFMAQSEDTGLDAAIVPFPHPVTQSREYLAAARRMAPTAGSGYRAALWEPTLTTVLNELFTSRWGEPMDPSAWAAYQSVRILFEASLAAGSTEGSALARYLEGPEAVFDLGKGPGVRFDPGDHQLHQPLYIVHVNPNGDWGMQLSRKLGVASPAGRVSFSAAGGARVHRCVESVDDPSGGEIQC